MFFLNKVRLYPGLPPHEVQKAENSSKNPEKSGKRNRKSGKKSGNLYF
jgi:hypothetical protein